MDVKQATQIASNHLNNLYDGQFISNVLLEEIELTEDEEFWLITISFQPPGEIISSRRRYKTFKIDATTGELQSMKMREVFVG